MHVWSYCWVKEVRQRSWWLVGAHMCVVITLSCVSWFVIICHAYCKCVGVGIAEPHASASQLNCSQVPRCIILASLATSGRMSYSPDVVLQTSNCISTSTSYDCCRDLSVDEAVELGRRAIYHATFRDCASGGTVSGK